MRIELEKLADKFSGLVSGLDNPEVECADSTSIQRFEEALSSTNERLNYVVKQRDELELELEKLKENMTELGRKKEFAEKDLDDYKFCMERELKKAKEEDRQKIIEIAELMTKISEMQESEKVLRQKDAENKDLENRFNFLAKEKLALEEKVRLLEEKTLVNDEVESLKKMMSEKEQTINEKQREIDSIQVEKLLLKEQVDEGLGMQAQLEDTVRELEKQKDELLTRLVDFEEKAVSANSSEALRTEISVALSKVAELQDQLKMEIQESDNLSSKLVEKVNELNNTLKASMKAEKDLASAEKENQELREINRTLQNKLNLDEQSVKDFDEVKSALSGILTPYIERANLSHEESLAVRKENAALKETLAIRENEKNKLSERLEEAEKERHLLSSKITLMEESTVDIMKHEAVSNKLLLLENQIKVYEESTFKLENEIIALKDELSLKTGDVERLRTVKAELENQATLFENKMKLLEAESVLLKEKGDMKEALELFSKNIESKLKEELASIYNMVKEAENREEICSLKKKNEALEDAIRSLKQDLCESKTHLSSSEKEKQSLTIKLNELEKNRIELNEYSVMKDSLSSWQSKVSELERVIVSLRSEAQIFRDALSSKAEEVEQALASKTEIVEQMSVLVKENEKNIESNRLLEEKLRLKEKEILRAQELKCTSDEEFINLKKKATESEEMARRISYLERENRRLGDACDDADEEITELRKSLFEIRRKLANMEGAQQGLTEVEIMKKLGCIDCVPQLLLDETTGKQITKKTDVNPLKIGEESGAKLSNPSKGEALTPHSASPNLSNSGMKSSSAKKQRSEQCRQQ